MAKNNKFTTFLAVLMTLIAAGGVIAFGASTIGLRILIKPRRI